ncbi:MAG: hypothetical protein R2715_10390 [Ilumatobacteraceae bacterium]
MGVKPTPGRGLTMLDIAVGSYGEVPDRPPHRSMAPRDADVDPDTPDMGYLLNRKTDVWAENVTELYEEAVAGSEATRHPVVGVAGIAGRHRARAGASVHDAPPRSR